MVNAIAAAAPSLSGENSLMLYPHSLPERYGVFFPPVEVLPPEGFESAHEDHSGHDVLYYDRHGRIQRLFQKGQRVNTLS